MPKRKPRSPIARALEKLVAKHESNPFAAYAALEEAMEALGLIGGSNRAADRVFERAARSIDPEEFEQDVAELLQQRVDAHSGRKLRTAGENTTGRRPHTVAPATLLAEVQALHAAKPEWTFNQVCSAVAKNHKYKSAWSAKQAAAAIKWPRPK